MGPSQANMDRSKELRAAVRKVGGEAELVGELQHAFVALVMGQSLQGLDAWRGILSLALQSDDAMLGDLAGAVAAVMRALAAQIGSAGADEPVGEALGVEFAGDILSGSFLR